MPALELAAPFVASQTPILKAEIMAVPAGFPIVLANVGRNGRIGDAGQKARENGIRR